MEKDLTKTSDTHSIGNSAVKKQSPVVSEKLVRSASVGKRDSAFNFLKDIEEKVLRCPSKINPPNQTNKYNVKDNIWLNFQTSQGKEKKKKLYEKDPFANFDSDIISPEKHKNLSKNDDSPIKKSSTFSQETSSPTLIPQEVQKIQLKRSK